MGKDDMVNLHMSPLVAGFSCWKSQRVPETVRPPGGLQGFEYDFSNTIFLLPIHSW